MKAKSTAMTGTFVSFAAALGVIALFVAAKHRKLASLVGADEGGPAPDG